MKKKPASSEALDKMRTADAEAVWDGKFRCCGLPVKGTPRQIAALVDEHLGKGCPKHNGS